MAVNFMLSLAALVEKRELEKSTNVGAVAGEGDEDGDIRGIVFRVLAVGIEVDCPLITADREGLARYVLADAHPLRQRIPLYREPVRAVHRLGHGTRPRRRAQRMGHRFHDVKMGGTAGEDESRYRMIRNRKFEIGRT